MRFTPVSDEEINAEKEERQKKYGAWPRGKYGFEIVSSEEKVSKAGNPMIELTLEVYSDSGDARQLNDYLLESGKEKLKGCARACGLLDKYNQGELTAYDLLGKSGHLTLRIRKQPGYPDKNEVEGYLSPVAPNPTPRDLDDEIPF